MRIREYRSEDFDELWRLDQECFPAGIAYSRFELMHYIRGRGAFTFVAESGRRIGGFIVAECRHGVRGSRLQAARGATGHIITIDVASWTRRSGIGTLLMDRAEQYMRDQNCRVTYLETAVDNLPAINFYERRGYSVLSSIRGYYNGETDALVMGKRLGAEMARQEH